MTDTPARKPEFLAECMLLLVALMWGMNPPVIKLGLQHIPPLPYNVARMVVGSLVAGVALWLSGTYRPLRREDRGRLLRAAIFGFFVFQLLFTEGIQRTTSGNAAFMFCLLPVFVLVLNRLYGFDTISRAAVLGIACSMAGVVLIVIGTGGELSLAGGHLLGALLILGSQIGYAYYTVFSRELLDRYSTYQVTAYLMGISTVLIVAVSWTQTRVVPWTNLPAMAWGSVIFSAMFGLCLGNFLWIWASGVLGTARASVFNNLTPVFAVITAYFLLGERFGPLQAAGAVFVFGGVYIARNRERFQGTWLRPARAKSSTTDRSPGS